VPPRAEDDPHRVRNADPEVYESTMHCANVYEFVSGLQQLARLTLLDLAYNQIDSFTMRELAKVLSDRPQLRHLELLHTALDPGAVQALPGTLPSLMALTYLSLGFASPGTLAQAHLVAYSCEPWWEGLGKMLTLVHLDLRGIGAASWPHYEEACVARLGEYLALLTKLQHLNLCYMDSVWCTMAPQLQPHLSTLTGLTFLDLDHTCECAGDLVPLARFWRACRTCATSHSQAPSCMGQTLPRRRSV
jgi:hypothetical protein